MCILCPVSHTSKLLPGLCKGQSDRPWPSYRKTRRLALSDLEPVSQDKCRSGKEENILFSFFMTHIKFPLASTNLVRTIKLPDCDSGLNNTFNQRRGCAPWFSLWETILRDSTTQDESRQKHGKGWTNFSKQMGTDNKAQF